MCRSPFCPCHTAKPAWFFGILTLSVKLFPLPSPFLPPSCLSLILVKNLSLLKIFILLTYVWRWPSALSLYHVAALLNVKTHTQSGVAFSSTHLSPSCLQFLRFIACLFYCFSLEILTEWFLKFLLYPFKIFLLARLKIPKGNHEFPW